MNIIIICITVCVCIYIICYFINTAIEKVSDNESLLNSISSDLDNIRFIVSKVQDIEIYDSTIRNNIELISIILNKYESETRESSSEESKFS